MTIDFEKFQDKDAKDMERTLSKIIIPYSKMLNESHNGDFYQGYERIPFNKRHPIFKALMKLEFEEVIRAHSRKHV